MQIGKGVSILALGAAVAACLAAAVAASAGEPVSGERTILAGGMGMMGGMGMHRNMMQGMMGGMMGVAAPDPVQLKILLGYLQRHAQKPIDAATYPDLDTPPGRAFGTTCMQCHALPDPRQHAAQEWPSVVARMRGHMAAMGKALPDETATDEIVDFLQRHSAAQK